MPGCQVNTAGLVADAPMTDGELIDYIEALRAKNNKCWMDLVRLAFAVAPDRARELMREIRRLDQAISRATGDLAR